MEKNFPVILSVHLSQNFAPYLFFQIPEILDGGGQTGIEIA